MVKKWYLSKLAWAGIIQFLIGALGLLAEFLKAGDYSPFAVVMLISGILVFVTRVWFTNSAIG